MQHPGKQLTFVLLSVLDLTLTCWLLHGSEGQVYEVNPLACWCLARHGLPGLACFKALAVATVLGLSILIARFKPLAAGRILAFGCAALAFIVVYSVSLFRSAALSPEARAAQFARNDRLVLAELNRRQPQLDRQRRDYRALLARLCEDLIANRCNLHEAAQRAADSERGSDPAWRHTLTHQHPGRTLHEAFAACLMCHAVASLEQAPQAAWALAHRLEHDFRMTYGSPPPLHHRTHLPPPRSGTKEKPSGLLGPTGQQGSL